MSHNLPLFLDCAAAHYLPVLVPIYILFLIPSIGISGYYCPQSIDNLWATLLPLFRWLFHVMFCFFFRGCIIGLACVSISILPILLTSIICFVLFVSDIFFSLSYLIEAHWQEIWIRPHRRHATNHAEWVISPASTEWDSQIRWSNTLALFTQWTNHIQIRCLTQSWLNASLNMASHLKHITSSKTKEV